MVRVRRPNNSVFRDILEQQYDENAKYKLYRSVKGSKDYVQRLGLWKVLPIHSGCVNCICWNEKGDQLLSGSDDQHLVISHAYNYKVLSNYKTSHKANIFSAKFLPCTSDCRIVSCSGDGMILYSDLLRLNETHQNVFNCHVGTTYEVATVPNDPYTFLSCGEDYTVRSFDLRIKERCMKQRCMDDVIISCQRAVTALTVNVTCPYQLAIGCSDSTVRIYDRRMLSPSAGDMAKPLMTYIAPGMEGRSYRITSLSFSPKGEDILVSYSSEHVYLFGVQNGNTTTLSTAGISVTEPESVDNDSPIAPVRRLRLRGDWSDTGPDARPQNYVPSGGASQARPTLHGTLMQRMTDVLSRMLNDPATRAALSHGGEGAFPESDPSSHSEPPPHAGGSEGDDAEEGSASGEVVDPEAAPDPLDLPLPSFSASFTQSSQPDVQEETMEVEQIASRSESEEEQRKLEAPSTSSASSSPSTSTASESSSPPSSSASSSSGPSSAQSSASNAPIGTVTSSISTSFPPQSNVSFSELSSMYRGFLEKRDSEPLVMYSDVGSDASCIVIVSGKQSSQETQLDPLSQDSHSTPSSSQTPPPKENPEPPEELKNSPHLIGTKEMQSPRAQEQEDFSLIDSEQDYSPLRQTDCRRFQTIEKHVDDAIINEKKENNLKWKDEAHKTKKSYVKQKYVGHRNARTMIKEATFWGEDYVISGSDCGHVLMWERDSGKLQMLLQADHHVVNCVQPHPYLPLLATSGIDYDVKLWAPVRNEPCFDREAADELMKRNAVMLEETKDTITVPASFMIRMLACLNQIRRGGRGRPPRRDSSTNSD